MKIGFFEVEAWEQEGIKAALGSSGELYFSQNKIDEDNLPELKDLDVISIFVNSKITPKVLEALPSLKFIATRSTGYDHIDLQSCKAKGVQVAFVPSYGINTVAEQAFGLILNLTRKMYWAINQIKEREQFDYKGLQGIDLKGKTLGVIGTGKIGKESINIGQGFGMNIVAYDAYPDADYAKQKGFEYVSLDDLLAKADIITIHAIYNEGTHHLINTGNISKIKKGAYLVNTARGAIVETKALVDALESGILAGAGLDVLEEEGEIKDEMHFLSLGHPQAEKLQNVLYDHMLMRMPNVLITPHNAFNTKEALERINQTSIDNIKGFLETKPVNLIPA